MSDNDLTEAFVSFVEGRPGVQIRPKRNHASATVNGKVFAYDRADGVVIKLPAPRVDDLEASGDAPRLVMGSKRMAEWSVLPVAGVEDLERFGGLFDEAIAFVSDD